MGNVTEYNLPRDRVVVCMLCNAEFPNRALWHKPEQIYGLYFNRQGNPCSNPGYMYWENTHCPYCSSESYKDKNENNNIVMKTKPQCCSIQ